MKAWFLGADTARMYRLGIEGNHLENVHSFLLCATADVSNEDLNKKYNFNTNTSVITKILLKWVQLSTLIMYVK